MLSDRFASSVAASFEINLMGAKALNN